MLDSVPAQKLGHYCDNSAVLHNIKRGYTEKLCFLQRAAQLRTSFLTDVNTQGLVDSKHVVTKENLADLLTKVLGPEQTRRASEMVSLDVGGRLHWDPFAARPTVTVVTEDEDLAKRVLEACQ